MDFSSSSSSFCKAPICETAAEREHMFEKVVTPSDVGKLNRLVIPKQHAEKYFPLDSAAGEKGLLLNFDESGGTGKSWRFRYSYWSSSQSYVITKGWSRFVKDKQLFAGDVVSFFRGSGDGRFFIDWRRRPAAERSQLQHGISLHRPINLLHHHHHHPSWCYPSSVITPVSPPLLVGPRPYNYGYGVISPNYSCLQSQFVGGAGPTRFETVPVGSEKAAPKRLRLFGVNMDCHVTSTDQAQDCDVVLSSRPHERVFSNNHQIRTSSSSAALQLRLHGGDLSSSAAATSKINRVAVNFLDKGKSSLSLDFGV